MSDPERPKQPTILERRIAEEQAKVEGYDEIIEELEAALEDAREQRSEHLRNIEMISSWRYAGRPKDPDV